MLNSNVLAGELLYRFKAVVGNGWRLLCVSLVLLLETRRKPILGGSAPALTYRDVGNAGAAGAETGHAGEGLKQQHQTYLKVLMGVQLF